MLATHGTVGRSASGGEGFCTDEGRRTTSRLRQARGVVVGGVDISGAEFRAQAGDDAVARVAGVYLESSTRADVPLYERLGFRETGPINAYGTEDPTGMWWVA